MGNKRNLWRKAMGDNSLRERKGTVKNLRRKGKNGYWAEGRRSRENIQNHLMGGGAGADKKVEF